MAWMPSFRRPAVMLAISLSLVAIFAGLLGWRLWIASESGWTGFVYAPPLERSVPVPRVPLFVGAPGYVAAVLDGSPAAAAGVAVGDRVLSVGGIPPDDSSRIATLSSSRHAGDVVAYRFQRGKQIRDVTLRLVSPFHFPRII